MKWSIVMKHVAKKKIQSVDFKNTDNNIIDRDINSLIRELKEQDALEERQREERINKIFKEVLVNDK